MNASQRHSETIWSAYSNAYDLTEQPYSAVSLFLTGFWKVALLHQGKVDVGHLRAQLPFSLSIADGEPKLGYQGHDDIREVDARWGRMISEGLRG